LDLTSSLKAGSENSLAGSSTVDLVTDFSSLGFLLYLFLDLVAGFLEAVLVDFLAAVFATFLDEVFLDVLDFVFIGVLVALVEPFVKGFLILDFLAVGFLEDVLVENALGLDFVFTSDFTECFLVGFTIIFTSYWSLVKKVISDTIC